MIFVFSLSSDSSPHVVIALIGAKTDLKDKINVNESMLLNFMSGMNEHYQSFLKKKTNLFFNF